MLGFCACALAGATLLGAAQPARASTARAAQDTEKITTLAAALVARGEPAPLGTLRFEYWFPFEGGKPPWVSGMAQAVAAQSLARASTIVDPTLLDPARAAYGLLAHWL